MNAIIMFFIVGIFLFAALAAFVFWLWAIVDCLKSDSTAEYKLLWLLVIIFLNVIGALIYFIFSGQSKDMSFGSPGTKGKRLTKSSDDKILAGVCGGIAKYFGIDSAIVRIVFVLLVFFVLQFLGLFLYIVAAIVIPSDSTQKSPSKASSKSSPRTSQKTGDSKAAVKSSSSYKAKKAKQGENTSEGTKGPSRKPAPASSSGSGRGVLFVLLAILLTVFVVVSVIGSAFISYTFISTATDSPGMQEIIKEHVLIERKIDSMNEVEMVSRVISESHNFVEYNGHNMVLLEITEPSKEDCSVFHRDPYGLRIYDSGCRQYHHRFSTDGTGGIHGYEVITIVVRGEIISMSFHEFHNDFHESDLVDVEDEYGREISSSYGDVNECLPQQKDDGICMTLWEPVCGYTIHPDNCPDCGETFSNSCFACSEPDIIYYREGECR